MPKFSIIVPAHRPYRLQECIESVLRQSFKDWELILVPNGGLNILPNFGDDRIKIVDGHHLSNSIGHIKNFAFSQGQGEYLVELDSDDLLLPGALDVLDHHTKTGSDFYYSDDVIFRDPMNPHPVQPFSPYWGWRYEDFKVRVGDEKIEGTRYFSFRPQPITFSYIWTAPDHVRVWKKDFYRKIGGHNPSFNVCDDHDLLIRTYLNGSVEHIPQCIYAYRVVGNNTWQTRNQLIQDTTKRLYTENIEALVLRWCQLQELPAYDLGGGINRRTGWISVDLQGGEVTADLNEEWPWEDNSVGAFRAKDLWEHLPDKQHTMNEMHRCLAPGGYVLSLTPDGRSQAGMSDPTHVSSWVPRSFEYYTHQNTASYIRNYDKRFRCIHKWNGYFSDYDKENDLKYVEWHAYALKGGSEEELYGARDWPYERAKTKMELLK